LSPTQAASNDCQHSGQRRKADQNLLHLLGVLLETDDALILAKRVGKSKWCRNESTFFATEIINTQLWKISLAQIKLIIMEIKINPTNRYSTKCKN
jgi:hypothetical protein